MTALLAILKGIAVLAIGLMLRLALVVLVLAAVSVPILLAYLALVELRDLVRRRRGLSMLGGFPWRSGLLHTAGHLWMKPAAAGFRVGIDGIAQRLLPGVVRVALPAEGARLRRGEPIAEVVTRTRRVPLGSPMDAVVENVNHHLQDDPKRLERDPYVGGWLVSLRPARPERERHLCLEGEEAKEWFRSESRWLAGILEQELGTAAADGGEPVVGLEQSLSRAQWAKLTRSFLDAA
jgi:glycine cleavage system H protein